MSHLFFSSWLFNQAFYVSTKLHSMLLNQTFLHILLHFFTAWKKKWQVDQPLTEWHISPHVLTFPGVMALESEAHQNISFGRSHYIFFSVLLIFTLIFSDCGPIILIIGIDSNFDVTLNLSFPFRVRIWSILQKITCTVYTANIYFLQLNIDRHTLYMQAFNHQHGLLLWTQLGSFYFHSWILDFGLKVDYILSYDPFGPEAGLFSDFSLEKEP